MNPAIEVAARTVAIGAGATLCMDVWAQVLRRGFGVRSLDFALLGRWAGHMPRGRFTHTPIGKSPAIRGERPLGWALHYAIGISFACLLVAIWGSQWLRSPTLPPPLIVALITLAAPLLVMQPAMGMGLAASRAPRPWLARLKSLGTHLVYGLGLYGSAIALAQVQM